MPDNNPEQIITLVFEALGIRNGEWQSLDVIDQGCYYILENEELLHSTLPKKVVGNLTLLKSNIPLVRRKSLMGFVRRCCAFQHSAILRKRQQVRVQNKTVSLYSYKMIN